MSIDFSNYSLFLYKDDKLVYTSNYSGLRPLVMCLSQHKDGPFELHDKVVGLAAAKIIVNSKVISKIKTSLISKAALDYLKDIVEIEYKELVQNILTQDKTDICPMEKKAMELSDEDFIAQINKIFNKQQQ